MLKLLLTATVALAVQPAAAAMVSMELSYTGEFFQDVVDFSKWEETDSISDGEPLGFSGRFSSLTPGDSVQASFSIDDNGGQWSVYDCMFAGTACESDVVNVNTTMQTLSLSGSGVVSLLYDFDARTVLYYEDGVGGVTDLGLFRHYGANFDISSVNIRDTAVVPLPAAGWALVAALAALGIAGRRRPA